jgi:hypothetical protein
MDSESEKGFSEVFKVLGEHGVEFAPYMCNILDTLGYNCLQAMANINVDNLSELETCVRSILGDQEAYGKMDDETKERYFGRVFKNSPGRFVFLPGDKAVLRAAVAVSKNLLGSSLFVACNNRNTRFHRKRKTPDSSQPRSVISSNQMTGTTKLSLEVRAMNVIQF